jgi:uncharacterized membrane protein YfcA
MFEKLLFPSSGVETYLWLPPLVAFCVSFFTSMGGVSGAFLLLPFQVSVLNFSSPAVSPTNLVYNIVAIPSGVYRYIREGRMSWPLTYITIVGTLPGVFLGFILRIKYFPDPKAFKFFVGLVLLYIGLRLVYDLSGINKNAAEENKRQEAEFNKRFAEIKKKTAETGVLPAEAIVRTLSWSLRKITYQFYGETFTFNVPGIFLLALIVGVIGGTYGIGGGAIIAPFVVSVFRQPIYTVAGAALMGTFLTSIAGVIFYSLIGPYYADQGLAVSPDWLLGALFGAGGFLGMYLGARCQKYVPAKVIKAMLSAMLTFLALSYIVGYFR